MARTFGSRFAGARAILICSAGMHWNWATAGWPRRQEKRPARPRWPIRPRQGRKCATHAGGRAHRFEDFVAGSVPRLTPDMA